MRLIDRREFVNPRYDGCHPWLRECLVLCLDKYTGKVSSIYTHIEGTFAPFSFFILGGLRELDVKEQYNKIEELWSPGKEKDREKEVQKNLTF